MITLYTKDPEYLTPEKKELFYRGEIDPDDDKKFNLDYDNGASSGYHEGIDFIEKYNSYILIKTSDYQDNDYRYAYKISDQTARQKIIEAGKIRLFEKREFKKLEKGV
jgi:hypothetical protein